MQDVFDDTALTEKPAPVLVARDSVLPEIEPSMQPNDKSSDGDEEMTPAAEFDDFTLGLAPKASYTSEDSVPKVSAGSFTNPFEVEES